MAVSDPNAPCEHPFSRVWITLITRSSYLPGVALLVHSLYKHRSIHPFIIQYTDALEQKTIDCLDRLCALYPLLRLQRVEPIGLPQGLKPVATRFDDTMTKLRAFQPFSPKLLRQWGFDHAPVDACFLDADMLIFRNPDDVFDVPRPSKEWIAAHHACKCNLDKDPWAEPDWTPENCPNSHVPPSQALRPQIPSTSSHDPNIPPLFRLCNSGVFLFSPTQDMWTRMERFLYEDPRVNTFTFPDQDFIDAFFWDRWVPLGWQYNALKTHIYWHTNLWRDDEVRALHYIVDKPWSARVAKDGTAGYLKRDGVTHGWWWAAYEEWVSWLDARDGLDVLDAVNHHVAMPTRPRAKVNGLNGVNGSENKENGHVLNGREQYGLVENGHTGDARLKIGQKGLLGRNGLAVTIKQA